MHILMVYASLSCVTDKCKFFLTEYAMFQKLAPSRNDHYFLPYFLGMIDELKRRGTEK